MARAGRNAHDEAARMVAGRFGKALAQLTLDGSVLLPAGVLSTEWITWLCSK